MPVLAALGLPQSSFFAVGLLAPAAVVEQTEWMTMNWRLRVITANFFVEEMAHDTVIQKSLCQFLKTEINTRFHFLVIDFSLVPGSQR